MARNTQVKVVVKSLDKFVGRIVQRLVLNVTAALRENPPLGTPVDTGWAAANWVPSIGSPFKGTAGQRVRGNIDTTPQALGLAKVATTYTVKRGPVYVTNNVPYIVKLNEGSSRQSPRAFVQAAIFRGVRETLKKVA